MSGELSTHPSALSNALRFPAARFQLLVRFADEAQIENIGGLDLSLSFRSPSHVVDHRLKNLVRTESFAEDQLGIDVIDRIGQLAVFQPQSVHHIFDRRLPFAEEENHALEAGADEAGDLSWILFDLFVRRGKSALDKVGVVARRRELREAFLLSHYACRGIKERCLNRLSLHRRVADLVSSHDDEIDVLRRVQTVLLQDLSRYDG